MKKRTSHSISDEGKELLRQLAARMGLSQAGVIETLIREEARRNQETIVDIWNRTNPIGTQVRYFPVSGSPEFSPTQTRSQAWLLSNGESVVRIKGNPGAVSLRNLEVIGE